MDTQTDPWAIPTEYPPASPDLGRVRFRAGEGGDMPRLWAEFMLNMWWGSRDKKLTFADAVKAATVHFMVGEQP